MRSILISIIVALFICGSHASAEETNAAKSPVEELRLRTSPDLINYIQLRFETASYAARISGSSENPYVKVEEEVSGYRETAKVAYTQVLKQVKGNSEAQKHLKEFYALWLAALHGTAPQVFEKEYAYRIRQGESVRRLNEAWYRFETEIDAP